MVVKRISGSLLVVLSALLACGGGGGAGGSSSTASGTGGSGGPLPEVTTVFNSGTEGAMRVVSDGTAVYISTRSSISDYVVTCPASGCPTNPTILGYGRKMAALALDAQRVYWAHLDVLGAEVLACAIGGCGTKAQSLTGPLEGSILSLAVDASRFYFSVDPLEGGTGDVLACPLAGCAGAPAVLAPAPGSGATSLVARGGQVTFTTADAVRTCAASGCQGAPTALAQKRDHPRAVAADDDAVYWIEDEQAGGPSTIFACPRSGCPGGPTALVTDATVINSFAVEGGTLYYGTKFGAIYRCPVAGGAQPAPATAPVSSEGAYSITVDANAIYWVTIDGAVLSAPR